MNQTKYGVKDQATYGNFVIEYQTIDEKWWEGMQGTYGKPWGEIQLLHDECWGEIQADCKDYQIEYEKHETF
jgi:hypothetical protein